MGRAEKTTTVPMDPTSPVRPGKHRFIIDNRFEGQAVVIGRSRLKVKGGYGMFCNAELHKIVKDVREGRMPGAALATLLELMAEMPYSSRVELSPTALARRLGSSRMTIYNHLGKLEELGYVCKIEGAATLSGKPEYMINPDVAWKGRSQNNQDVRSAWSRITRETASASQKREALEKCDGAIEAANAKQAEHLKLERLNDLTLADLPGSNEEKARALGEREARDLARWASTKNPIWAEGFLQELDRLRSPGQDGLE